jgi:hypothetical protein
VVARSRNKRRDDIAIPVAEGDYLIALDLLVQANPNGAPTPLALFKPGLMESTHAWMPEDGEPAREALASRAGELLGAMTGINFGVPTTNVIQVGRKRIADYKGPNVRPGAVVTGSLQQFSANNGDLRSQFMQQKGNVSAANCERIAILDTCILNLDRHPGNLLLNQNGVIPIDHGVSLPTAEAVRSGATCDLISKNVLLQLPNAYQNFSLDTQFAIRNISPKLIKDAMKAERDTVGHVHAQLANTVGDESFDISERSTIFLQMAAGLLPPTVVQIALGARGKDLLDPSVLDQDFKQRSRQIIERYADNIAGLKDFYMLTVGERQAIESACSKASLPTDPAWLHDNIGIAVDFVRSGAELINPEPSSDTLQMAKSWAAELDIKLEIENATNWDTICEFGAWRSGHITAPPTG